MTFSDCWLVYCGIENFCAVQIMHKHNFSDSCNIEFIHLTLFVCPIGRKKSYIGIALTIYRSVHHENLTLPCILMFLHQTFKLYCLWPDGHNNAKFFRSGSHFARVLPLFAHGFCHQNLTLWIFVPWFPGSTHGRCLKLPKLWSLPVSKTLAGSHHSTDWVDISH